jgi:DNA-binding NarL/FixJ family response regulator
VIVTDIAMPLLNGIDALKLIKKAGLRSKVVILTMHEEATMAVESLKAGADGCVTKRSASTELVAAINEVFSGRTYVSPSIEGDIYFMLGKSEDKFDPRISPLSPRQREILQLTAEGKSMKEIAELLKISPRTVESHKYSSMQILGLKSTAELVQYAIKMRLI